MSTVAIVGAGAAGLVAAKTFLQHGGYTVTIFEAKDRIGGMWRDDEHCPPGLKTNLSRFTVAFSDLSWDSVNLSKNGSDESSKPSPIFPQAWQVGRYLETYAEKFGLLPHIQFNRSVVSASDPGEYFSTGPWSVTTVDSKTGSNSKTQKFNYLIVASGFFNDPVPTLLSSKPNDNHVQHSSKFQELSSLSDCSGNIVVVGGGISGSEAAAKAAFQISTAKHSPGKVDRLHADSKVYHITNRPFYALPRYLPHNPSRPDAGSDNLAPNFLPIDLILYDLSRRGGGQISAAIGEVPPEKARAGHTFLRSMIGGNQADLGEPALVYTDEQLQYPAYTGITDTYAEFVRSGTIVPIRGRVEEIDENLDISIQQYEPWYHAPFKQGSNKSTLRNNIGIIEATGYRANLDFFPDTIKDWLYWNHETPRIPILLTRGSIFATDMPFLGFVGFYEGPYWGFMEMQARFIVETWSTNNVGYGYLPEQDLYQHDVTERMRHAMRWSWSLHIPQFWQPDYVGLVEEFARHTSTPRDDSTLEALEGPVFPARYHSAAIDSDSTRVMEEVAAVIKASKDDARFVAAAVFRGMQGLWRLNREIKSRNAAAPGGTFSGVAHFHPRTPTDNLYAAEYLYVEEGTFTMTTGVSFTATRRYVYRYNETTDKVTAWFVSEDNLTTSNLFNTWDFYAPSTVAEGWKAKGHHWCSPDTYKNNCEFQFRGANIRKFRITYEVAGPNKDYTHVSWYERPGNKKAEA